MLLTGKTLRFSEALEGRDKFIVRRDQAFLGGDLTEQDIQMLLDRRRTLEHFHRLLIDPEFFDSEKLRLDLDKRETSWRKISSSETPGSSAMDLRCWPAKSLTMKSLKKPPPGSNVFTGGGKRSDALMRTKGFIQTLLFGEIKTHDTDLLLQSLNIESLTCTRFHISLAVLFLRVQKTAFKAVKTLEVLHRARTPAGVFQFEVSTVRPRQIVIIGNLAELFDDGEVNLEKWTSFEYFDATIRRWK